MQEDGDERRVRRSRPGLGTVRLLLILAAAVVAVPLAVLPLASQQWGLPVAEQPSLVPVPPPGPDPGPSPQPAPDVELPPGAVLPPDATLPPPALLLPPYPPGEAVPGAPGVPGVPALPPGVPRADLAVALRSDPVAPAAGRPIVYTLTMTSKGPDPTARTTLVDTLPPGFVFRSADAPAGTRCTPVGATVTCEGPGLRPGDSRSVAITALVPDRTAADPFPNSARVTSDLPDPGPGDDVAVGAARVERGADLFPVAVVPPTPVVPGTRVVLGAEATNRGPSSAEGVVLAAVLPPGVTFVSGTVPGGECTAGGSDVSCRLAGPLAPAATAAARLLVAVDAGYAGEALTHTVTASAATPDPFPAGNTAAARAVVAPRTDLAVTTTGPRGLAAGTEGTWVTVVTNRGPSVARDVTVVAVPTGLVPTDVDASSGTCSAGTGVPDCALGTLGPGESTRVRTVAAAPPNAPAGPVGLVARARSATPPARPAPGAPQAPTAPAPAVDEDPFTTPGDATPGDTGAERTPGSTGAPGATTTTGTPTDTAAASAAVAGSADLAVAFSQQRPADPGGAAGLGTDFALGARNLGPSDATGAVLTAVVPDGLQVATVSPECVLAGQRVTCRFARVPVDGVAEAVFATRQTPGELSGPRQLRATVTATSPDPRPDNDTATATTGAADVADLSVVSAAPVGRVAAGEVATRTLTVRNGGPAAAQRVVLTDAAGPDATPVELPPGCRATAGGTACDLGTVAPGEERRVTLRVRLAPDHPPGPVTRSAAVRLAGDPSPSDNTVASTTTVLARADLTTTLTRVAAAPAVAGGAPVTYRVRARNAGPSSAPGVVLDLDTPPAGVRVLRATTGDGQCTVRASRALCPVATVAPGRAVDALVTVASAPDLPSGATVVSAAATSMVADPTRDDARAGLSAPVARVADLRTRVDAEPGAAAAGAVAPGARTTYRVGVTNVGPSLAARTTWSAVLPPGATAVAVTASRGRCAVLAGRVDCVAGDLGAGGRAVATVVVAVPPGARGPFAVTATAASATPDATPDPGAAGLALGVRGAPGAPGAPPEDAAPEAGAVPPGAEDTDVAAQDGASEVEQGEAVATVGSASQLPLLDALGLLLAGAAVPTLIGGLVLLRRRMR